MAPKRKAEDKSSRFAKRRKESDYEESSESESEYELDDDMQKRGVGGKFLSKGKKDSKKKAKPTKIAAVVATKPEYSFKNPNFELVSTSNRKGQWKQLKQLLTQEQRDIEKVPFGIDTYLSIEAPPSTLPAKKYCDLTGFVAKYTDPNTKLRFYGPREFHTLRQFPESVVQNILSIRKAETLLK